MIIESTDNNKTIGKKVKYKKEANLSKRLLLLSSSFSSKENPLKYKEFLLRTDEKAPNEGPRRNFAVGYKASRILLAG